MEVPSQTSAMPDQDGPAGMEFLGSSSPSPSVSFTLLGPPPPSLASSLPSFLSFILFVLGERERARHTTRHCILHAQPSSAPRRATSHRLLLFGKVTLGRDPLSPGSAFRTCSCSLFFFFSFFLSFSLEPLLAGLNAATLVHSRRVSASDGLGLQATATCSLLTEPQLFRLALGRFPRSFAWIVDCLTTSRAFRVAIQSVPALS